MWSIVTTTNFENAILRQDALIDNLNQKSSCKLNENKLAFKNNKFSKKSQTIRRFSIYQTEKIEDQFNTNFKTILHYHFVQKSNNQQFNKK